MSIMELLRAAEHIEYKPNSISVEDIKEIFGDLFYNKVKQEKIVLYTSDFGYKYFKLQLKMINFVKRLKRQYKNLDK